MSLKNRIYRYFEEWYLLDTTLWFSGQEIEDLARNDGYKASNASRRLRELENEGKLKRKYMNGYVQYRYKESEVIRIINKESRKMRHKQLSIL